MALETYLKNPFLEKEAEVEYQGLYAVRSAVTLGIFFSILLVIAGAILKRWLMRNQEESGYSFLSFILTSVGFAIAIAAMMLLPVTILANEVMIRYPDFYYTKWLTRKMIFELWNTIFIFTNVAMFLLLPFAYFYCEAHQPDENHNRFGIRVRKEQSFFSQFRETLYTLLLWLIMLGGILFLLIKPTTYNTMWDILKFNPLSYSMLSLIGSVIVLFSVPSGFSILARFGFSKTSFQQRSSASRELRAKQMELECLQWKEKHTKFYNTQKQTPSYQERHEQLQSEIKSLNSQASISSAYFWSTVALITNLFNIIIPPLLLAICTFHLMSHMAGLKTFFDFVTISDNHVTTTFTSIISLFDTIVIMSLMTYALVGSFSFPIMSMIRPKAHGTPMHILILNVGFYLLISSSFPVLGRVLGLISFDLMGFYADTRFLSHFAFHLGYPSLFLVLFMYQYVILFYHIIVRANQLLMGFTSRIKRVARPYLENLLSRQKIQISPSSGIWDLGSSLTDRALERIIKSDIVSPTKRHRFFDISETNSTRTNDSTTTNNSTRTNDSTTTNNSTRTNDSTTTNNSTRTNDSTTTKNSTRTNHASRANINIQTAILGPESRNSGLTQTAQESECAASDLPEAQAILRGSPFAKSLLESHFWHSDNESDCSSVEDDNDLELTPAEILNSLQRSSTTGDLVSQTQVELLSSSTETQNEEDTEDWTGNTHSIPRSASLDTGFVAFERAPVTPLRSSQHNRKLNLRVSFGAGLLAVDDPSFSPKHLSMSQTENELENLIEDLDR